MTKALQQMEDRYLALLIMRAQAQFERTLRGYQNYSSKSKFDVLKSVVDDLQQQIKHMEKEFQFEEPT